MVYNVIGINKDIIIVVNTAIKNMTFNITININ